MLVSRRRRVGLLLVLGALCAVVFGGCRVTKDDVATFKWAAYGNNNSSDKDWTGGDGASSTRLPDGRYVYAYNDMFEGLVNGDGSRNVGLFTARNALVMADTNDTPIDTLTHVNSQGVETGGDLVQPLPGTTERFMWGGGRGIIENNQLKLIANRIGPNDPLGDLRGTYIAAFSLPDLQMVGTQQQAPPPVLANKLIFWSDLFKSGSYTYIYGGGDVNQGGGGYVARAPAGNLGGPWEYRTTGGTGWSANEQDAVDVFPHMVGSASPIEYRGQFYAFGMELPDESHPELGVFSNHIRVCVASTPYGPFPNSQCTNVYTVPEAGQLVAPNTILIAYAVSPHFDDINGDGMLLSYSMHPFCAPPESCPSPSANQQNVAHYRPRWLRILPDN